jgi:hypothetical protein
MQQFRKTTTPNSDARLQVAKSDALLESCNNWKGRDKDK